MKSCLFRRCKNGARARGLCNTCYEYARRLVTSGATTWKRLERKGTALPAKGRGPKIGRDKFFGTQN